MGIVKKELIENKIRCLVNSSNLLETIYDPEKKVLNITFKGGRVYQYGNVDPKIYNQFELSESHGKSFHQIFKSLPSVRLADIDPSKLLSELAIKS